jgi:hypothetical protein
MTGGIRVSLGVLLVLALAAVPAGCASMPPTIPVTIPVLAAPPPMTGNLIADSGGGGWAGTLRIDLSATSYALLGRATESTGAQYVYLGIACDDFVPAPAARVVLGIVTKTLPPSCAWKIHFNPIPAPAGGGSCSTDEYWRNLGGWNAPGGSTVQPPGIGWPLPNTLVWAQGGGSNLWTLETKIFVNPVNNPNGIWFPAAGTNFSMYLNVLSNGNAGAPGNVQCPWPAGCTMLGNIKTNTPDVGVWALAQF